MKSNFIVGAVPELKAKILELEVQIKAIQNKCSHPIEALEKVPRSNTGNHDPSMDSYWYECYCHLCQKAWREEQQP